MRNILQVVTSLNIFLLTLAFPALVIWSFLSPPKKKQRGIRPLEIALIAVSALLVLSWGVLRLSAVGG